MAALCNVGVLVRLLYITGLVRSCPPSSCFKEGEGHMAKKQLKIKVSKGPTTHTTTIWEITYKENIQEVMNELLPDEWAYILHDKDVDVDGNPKKPHYHIWAKWHIGQRKERIRKILGHHDKYQVKGCKEGKKAALRYMTHETKESQELGKYIYERKNIVTNLDEDVVVGIFERENVKRNNVQLIFNVLNKFEKLIRKWNRDVHYYDEDGNAINDAGEVIIEPTFQVFIYELIDEDLLDLWLDKQYYNAIWSTEKRRIFGK